MIELAGLELVFLLLQLLEDLLFVPYGAIAAASLQGLYAQAPTLQPLLTPFFANYAGPSGGSGTLLLTTYLMDYQCHLVMIHVVHNLVVFPILNLDGQV